jgi:large subunit ribosomal protein L29
MKRARAHELNEDAVPGMVLHATKHRLAELFPVRFSAVDPLAEAEPSEAALVQLESGAFAAINYGTITQRVTISVPISANVRKTIEALLREAAIRAEEIIWVADTARGLLKSEEKLRRDRTAAMILPTLCTGTDSRMADPLRGRSESELRARELELRKLLFKLRFQRATGRDKNPMKMREVRREIARIESLLNERAKASS